MFRGRYQLGQEVTLGVLCVDAADTPTLPTSAPTVDVYSASSKVISGKAIPIMDRYGATGLFSYRLFLSETFSVGKYSVVYRYTADGDEGVEVDTFEVIDGGDPSGHPTSMHFYRRPHADFIVTGTDGGKVIKRRNPRL
jgi:hypothetical protein